MSDAWPDRCTLKLVCRNRAIRGNIHPQIPMHHRCCVDVTRRPHLMRTHTPLLCLTPNYRSGVGTWVRATGFVPAAPALWCEHPERGYKDLHMSTPPQPAKPQSHATLCGTALQLGTWAGQSRGDIFCRMYLSSSEFFFNDLIKVREYLNTSSQ